MGSCFSQDRVQPVPGDEMTESADPFKAKGDEFDGPVKKRTCTDTFFLVLFIAFIIGLLALVGYCFANGDVFRVINGYDNCGNICGRKNTPVSDPNLHCYGKDMTDKKFVKIRGNPAKAALDPKHTNRTCVADCKEEPGFIKLLNRCIPSKNDSHIAVREFYQEASKDLHLCWKEILYCCLIAFGLSIILLLLLRYVAGFVVWFVLAATVVTSIAATIYLWIMYKQKHAVIYGSDVSANTQEVEERKESSYLTYAILSTIATIIILMLVWVMRKRIQLVIDLFHEAGKAVNSMPMIFTLPIMTFFGLAIVVALWIVFELWIESSGYLRKVPDSQNLYYKKDGLMKTARVYNFIAMLWFTQFCIGAQQMIIAGAVATWFFTRDKSRINSPISTSISNMWWYHLGSVALGSLLITLVQILRIIMQAIKNQFEKSQGETARCVMQACQCCLYVFEKILVYLTRNAYIEIAIYGESFCRSGQQAYKMLSNNALRVAAINSVGDFVLFLGKVFITFITVLIASKMFEHKEGLQHMWLPLSLVALFAMLISHCFITVYEMVIDTIFICFCEDCELNDGISKPYYMSKDLMTYVENSNKVLAVGDEANRG